MRLQEIRKWHATTFPYVPQSREVTYVMMTTLWRMAALWNTIAGIWRDRRDLPLLITNPFAARCDCCLSARRKDLRRWYA